jgi:hypothetical protein
MHMEFSPVRVDERPKRGLIPGGGPVDQVRCHGAILTSRPGFQRRSSRSACAPDRRRWTRVYPDFFVTLNKLNADGRRERLRRGDAERAHPSTARA